MKKILLLLMLFASAKCFAQNNNAQLHFNLLSVKDGMPEGTVTDLLQDREGYMWIGTQKGLVRYDGYKLKVYDFGIKDPYGKIVQKIFEDSKGQLWTLLLSGFLYVYNPAHDNFTSCLQLQAFTYNVSEDAAGNIWLLGNSLIRYDPVTKKSETFGNKEKGKHYLDAESFYQTVNDKKQQLWVCSSNGLYEYNAKKNIFVAHLSHKDSAKRISISSIQEDAQQPGIFYMDTYNTYPFPGNEAFGRYSSNTDSLTLFRHREGDTNSIASNTLSGFYTDSKGRLWVSNFGGLSLFDASDQKFTNYVPEPSDAFKNTLVFITIKEDKAGNLWCNSEKGLYYFNVNTKQFQRDTIENNISNGLAGNLIQNVFVDRSGSLWFGANHNGLQQIDTRRSKYIQYGNSASTDIFFKGGAANAFTKAPDGSIWIGAHNGLYHQTPDGNFKQIQYQARKNNDVVTSCFYDSKGLLWIGTSGKPGLYCYDPATGKTIDYSYALTGTANSNFADIRSICEDHLHAVWIGTWGNGIIRFNRESNTFTKFPFIVNNNTIADTHGALDDDQVECIYEDKEGILWVGTNNGGLNRFNRDKGTFTSYTSKVPGLICVININEDSKGRLWAGTYFGGLFKLNKNRDSLERFSEENGLLYDGIWATEEDNKGNIWSITPRGISVVYARTGKITSIKNINDFNGQSAIKTTHGLFYFGTTDGFITLNPNDFAPDKEPPVVHIESLHFTTFISDKPKDSAIVVDTVKQYKFSYNENRITFNYVGLYYKDPQGTQYAYKLDGYDKDWVQAGTQRTVTYTNLSPDTYTFHVKAMNSDGVWSKDESISFIITPPWWATWWFRIFSVIAMIVVVYFIVQKESRNLKKRNIMLEEKVLDRTKELKHSLEELRSTQAQLIQSEKMASLGELTAGIAHEIQNPLNFVNNFSEVNKEMLTELNEEIEKGNYNDAKAIAKDVIANEEKINHHGKRADAIVKGMLQHSQKSTGKKEPTNINALCDEYLRLAYHGFKAKDKNFNVTMQTDFDNSIEKINIIPQDIGRVLLNLFNNAFYAVNEKRKNLTGLEDLLGLVIVQTKKINDKVEIKVSDNGNGIPQNIVDKIFQPFFTTKPTGQGTGLGLSLSYDIIKAHGGEITVESKEGEGTEFKIYLAVS